MREINTLKDIRDSANEIIGANCLLEKPGSAKKKTCEYFCGGDNKQRFCKITTQLNCCNCRFYSASALAKKKALIYHMYAQSELIEGQMKKIKELEEKADVNAIHIRMMEPCVRAYRKILDAKTR